MKILCKCGRLITDNTDYKSDKAYVIRDKLYFGMMNKTAEEISEFLDACITGTRDTWLRSRERTEGAIQGKDLDIVYSLVYNPFLSSHLSMYQCWNCGRFHLDDRRGNGMLTFMPEDGVTDALDAEPHEWTLE